MNTIKIDVDLGPWQMHIMRDITTLMKHKEAEIDERVKAALERFDFGSAIDMYVREQVAALLHEQVGIITRLAIAGLKTKIEQAVAKAGTEAATKHFERATS